MAQITIRAEQELIERVKDAARAGGRSMNEYVVWVLDAATDVEMEGDEVERLRARLRRAGLLAEPEPWRGPLPDPELVKAAGRRAALGTPLSDIISQQRD